MRTGIVERFGPLNHRQVSFKARDLRVGVHISYSDYELGVLKEFDYVFQVGMVRNPALLPRSAQ